LLGNIQELLLLWDWMGLGVVSFELLYFFQQLKYTFFFSFKAVMLTVKVCSNG